MKLDRSIVLEAWKKAHVNLRSGGIYNPDTIKGAMRVLKQVLDANGESNSRVEEWTENLTAMTVNVNFVIRPNR